MAFSVDFPDGLATQGILWYKFGGFFEYGSDGRFETSCLRNLNEPEFFSRGVETGEMNLVTTKIKTLSHTVDERFLLNMTNERGSSYEFR